MAPSGEIQKIIPFGKQFPIKETSAMVADLRAAGCAPPSLKLRPNFLRHWHPRGTLAVKCQFPQYEKYYRAYE
jgi:hypothetical protein